MEPSTIVRTMLDTLDEEDCQADIQSLSESKEDSVANSKRALRAIRNMMDGDIGWESEEDMLSDMRRIK